MNGVEFEKKIIKALQNQDQLNGYGLFAYQLPHEIDGLLLLEPGVFICYEAKCYSGTWTGDANNPWRNQKTTIKSNGSNPNTQVQSYAFEIKNKLIEFFAQKPYHEDLDKIIRVGGIVVVPDDAEIKIDGAYVDTIDNESFYDRSIHICHLSKFVEVLKQVKTANRKVRDILRRIGGLEKIVEELAGNPEYVRHSIEKQVSKSLKIICRPGTFEDILGGQPNPKPEFLTQKPEPIRMIEQVSSSKLDKTEPTYRYWLLWIRVLFFLFSASFVSFLGFKYYQFISRPRLNKSEVRIGILTSPESYSELVKYLEDSFIPNDFPNFLLGQKKKIKVSLLTNTSLTYQATKQSIIDKEWDIVFTLSPYLSVIAKESDYRFIARMFPDKPAFYRSVLFVRSDSPIYSLRDLNEQTRVGLGDFQSTSSFYVPLYDLYGKTLTIETGLKKMATQVKKGVVDVGAGPSIIVEKDPEFRVIHISRDIPGSGVYVTPSFSEREKTVIQQVLLNAPKEIQQKANYGFGKEPDYTEFMKIRTRVDEILSCADFSKNLVKLFCSTSSLAIKGRINGSTLLDSVTVELKVMAENGSLYKVTVPRFFVPDFTQIQNKSITIKPVTPPQQVDINTYEIVITNSNQIFVEDSRATAWDNIPSQASKASPTLTDIPSAKGEKSEAPSSLLVGNIIDVRDGDSILVETREKGLIDIRLACIDAPEIDQTPWGEDSKEYLKQLLPKGTMISYRPVDTDTYGRLVAEVFINNKSINLEMVRQGEAVVYLRYLSSCEADRQKYLDTELQARRQNLGFWSQSNPEMPWEFRRRSRN